MGGGGHPQHRGQGYIPREKGEEGEGGGGTSTDTGTAAQSQQRTKANHEVSFQGILITAAGDASP